MKNLVVSSPAVRRRIPIAGAVLACLGLSSIGPASVDPPLSPLMPPAPARRQRSSDVQTLAPRARPDTYRRKRRLRGKARLMRDIAAVAHQPRYVYGIDMGRGESFSA